MMGTLSDEVYSNYSTSVRGLDVVAVGNVKESIRRIKKKIEDELQINTVRKERREPINIVFDAIDDEMGRDLI